MFTVAWQFDLVVALIVPVSVGWAAVVHEWEMR